MASLLTPEEIDSALIALPDWSGGPSGLTRKVTLPTFPTAITLVDRVAEVAERFGHHPDIDIRWRTLTFSCVTHSAGGVTAMDLELAAEIQRLLAEALAEQ
jgi:4a-hydroxytetrahydrobiopterin dehydratase